MAGVIITVTGLAETQQMLKSAPRSLVARSFLKGFEAAARVIETAVEAHTPVGGKKVFNEETFSEVLVEGGGELISALMHETNLDSDFRGGQVEVGFGKQGHKASWVEYGHRMVGHKPGKKELGMVRPHPFMRPAADECADAAIDAFASALVETLKEGF